MSFLYLWKPRGHRPEEAAQRFGHALARQAALYEQAFGYSFALRHHQVGAICVGQLEPPLGIAGWQAWQQVERYGLAWAGVCETLFGPPVPPAALAECVRALAARPEDAAAWNGRWAACGWDEDAERVTLTTSAYDSPTLWWAEGPHGWAAGSRALPLLELVGRPLELDLAAAGVFASFGYLAGPGALFRHVTRLPARSHVVVTPQQVETRTYVGLPEYLALGRQQPTADVAREAAAHLVTRVERQLAHSESPQLLLTGGRDSRCIAASAVASGYTGGARTSGPPAMPDVRVAAQVAGALAIPHQREDVAPRRSPMRALLDNQDRLGLWLTMTEGIETVRHAVAFQPFFERALPYPAQREQVFHGLNGLAGDSLRKAMNAGRGAAIDAPVDLAEARDVVLAHIPPELHVRVAARAAIDHALAQLHAEIAGLTLTAAHWCTLFYWQNRALQWGADGMSVKDVIAWHWTPLLDGTLTSAFLSTRGITGKQLIEAVTLAVAPQLNGIPYDKQPDTPLTALKRGVKWALKQAHRRGVPLPGTLGRSSKIPVDRDLLTFWEQVFFAQPRKFWPELVDETLLRATIANKPSSELLWNLATVELFARTHL
jgi:hypothetical protein